MGRVIQTNGWDSLARHLEYVHESTLAFDQLREYERAHSYNNGISELFRRLLKGERDLDSFLSNLNYQLEDEIHHHFSQITDTHNHYLGCMDPGVAVKSLALGGQGILLALAEGKEKGKEGLAALWAGIDSVLQVLGNDPDYVGIHCVLSHAGCAAVDLVYQQLNAKERASFKTVDDLGIQFSKKLAQSLHSNHYHVTPDQMNRPLHSIPSQAILYEGSDTGFRSGLVLSDALGFTISRGILERLNNPEKAAEQGRAQLQAAMNLMFGPKGLGDRFTPQRPALIFPIGGRAIGQEKLYNEANHVAQTMNGRVRVMRGFSMHAQRPFFDRRSAVKHFGR